jgi:hypothetical protein
MHKVCPCVLNQFSSVIYETKTSSHIYLHHFIQEFYSCDQGRIWTPIIGGDKNLIIIERKKFILII